MSIIKWLLMGLILLIGCKSPSIDSFDDLKNKGTVVRDSRKQFRLTIPEGYVRTHGSGSSRDVCTFARNGVNGNPEISISISRQYGTLSGSFLQTENKMLQQIIPFNSKVKSIQSSWGNYSLIGTEAIVLSGEKQIIVRQFDVPLAPKALIVTIGGEMKCDQEITSVMEQIIKSIEGKGSYSNEPNVFSRK